MCTVELINTGAVRNSAVEKAATLSEARQIARKMTMDHDVRDCVGLYYPGSYNDISGCGYPDEIINRALVGPGHNREAVVLRKTDREFSEINEIKEGAYAPKDLIV